MYESNRTLLARSALFATLALSLMLAPGCSNTVDESLADELRRCHGHRCNADLSTAPVDLATFTDLASAVDAATATDLASSPPDLASSPDLASPPPPPTACTSLPVLTPRAPKLLWSCERQAFLTKLKNLNHPQWQELIGFAERSGTSSAVSADSGAFAAVAYQITGDPRYADKAKTELLKRIAEHPSLDLNFVREYSALYAVVFDWIQGGISATDRTAIKNGLYGWINQVLARQPTSEPIRLEDTDQVTGTYFGAMFLAVATAGTPESDAILKNPVFGGWDAGPAGTRNMRTAIKTFVSDWAAGGEWMESSFYNAGTLRLILIGIEGVRTAIGPGHFPEADGWPEQVALDEMARLSSDWKVSAEWGDSDQPRNTMLYDIYQVLGMAVAQTPMTSANRPMIVAYANQLREAARNDIVTGPHWYMFFDPTAPSDTSWRTKLERSHYANGQGMVFARDTWDTSSSFLFMHLRRPQMGIDHENDQFGNFQLYRKGTTILTNPLGYGGGAVEPAAVNSMVIGGLDAMPDRVVVGHTAAPDGSFQYFAGTTKGNRYRQPYYDPPTTYLREWTQSFVYLASSAKTADTIVLFDRVDADVPTRLDRYYGDDRNRIAAAPHNKQFILHALVRPTFVGKTASWSVGTQSVVHTSLLPAQQTQTIVDEKTLSWPVNFPRDSERHFYASWSPVVEQPYDTFLNVVQASDSGVARGPVLVTSTDGQMQGTLVSRPGQRDALVLFSGNKTSRVRTTAFTVSFTSGTDGTDVYVADLDPSRSWSTSDGTKLDVDKGGLSRLTVTGTGAKAITVQ